jgi:uncharacterized SAM-binding protein YcdF (DUF218 family)
MLILLCITLGLGAFFFQKSHRWKKSILLTAAGLCLALSNGIVPSLLLNQLQTYPPFLDDSLHQWRPAYNFIVILGGGISQWQKSGRLVSNPLVQTRITEGARLYQDCRKHRSLPGSCLILLSGGDPNHMGISEAKCMQKELELLDVPSSDILLEPKSRNTFEKAQYIAQLIDSLIGPESFTSIAKPENPNQKPLVALVTSGFCMTRALQYFAHFQIEASPAPSDNLSTTNSLFTTSYHLLLTDLTLNEFIGMARLTIYNYLGWNKTITTASVST